MNSDEGTQGRDKAGHGKFTSLEALAAWIPANWAWDAGACPELLDACPIPLRPFMERALSGDALPPPVEPNLALVFRRVNPFRWLNYRAAPLRQEQGTLFVLTDHALEESSIQELNEATRWPVEPVIGTPEAVTGQLLACALARPATGLFEMYHALPAPLDWPGVEEQFLVWDGKGLVIMADDNRGPEDILQDLPEFLKRHPECPHGWLYREILRRAAG